MTKSIREAYLQRLLARDIVEFPLSDDDSAKISSALRRAEAIRDFEIGMYWTRTAYFWGIQVVLFGSFALSFQGIASIEGHHNSIELNLLGLGLMSIESLLGAVISYIWLLMAKGAKYWQDNWERHIDILEDFTHGPIYKTYFVGSDDLQRNPDFRPYSVTRANQHIISAVSIFWVAAGAISFWNLWGLEPSFLPDRNSLTVVFFMIVGLMAGACLCEGIASKSRMHDYGKVAPSLSGSPTYRLIFRKAFETYRE